MLRAKDAGFDPSDQQRRLRFYRRNGFVEDPDSEVMVKWLV